MIRRICIGILTILERNNATVVEPVHSDGLTIFAVCREHRSVKVLYQMNCSAIKRSGRKNAFHFISCKHCVVSTKGIRHELQYPFTLSLAAVGGIVARSVVIAKGGTGGGLGVSEGEESE